MHLSGSFPEQWAAGSKRGADVEHIVNPQTQAPMRRMRTLASGDRQGKSNSFCAPAWHKRLLTACVALLLAMPLTAAVPAMQAQQTPPTVPQTTPQTTPAAQPDQTAPDQGGPGGDNGSIAIPKKKEQPAPPPPPSSEPVIKNPPELSNYSLRVDVPTVTVDVGVILEKTHQFVPNLQEANFRVYEDGKPQQVTHFARIQAPITAVLLTEFAATNYNFIYDMRNAAYAFAEQLKPDDYIAVMTYDMHTEILTDFTQDKRLVAQALNSLTIPTWRETNLFDATYEALDRLSRVDGRKYLVLISSGRDTFSIRCSGRSKPRPMSPSTPSAPGSSHASWRKAGAWAAPVRSTISRPTTSSPPSPA